jgi:hypothetical protein
MEEHRNHDVIHFHPLIQEGKQGEIKILPA